MSAPTGNFGIAIFSYDKLSNTYDKPCAINVAPLERIGIAVSMDKASYNSSVAGVYGYPGDWGSNFIGILTYTSETSLTINDADTIATNGVVLPATQISDDGSTVAAQVIRMIPEDWADSTRIIHFIFQFVHNKSGVIETDYVVIPVHLTIRPFEDGTGAGLIQLISVEDESANDVSKGVCWDQLPETVTFTFQYNGLTPENYLFIPVIKSEFSDWREHNVWVNANLPQYTNELVISADEDFTGGTAELVLDASKFLMGDYCVAAIAKLDNPGAPVPCVETLDVTLDLILHMWTFESFTAKLQYLVIPPLGFTVERVELSLSFIRINAGPPFFFGYLIQLVETNVVGLIVDSISYPDNVIGQRPDAGTYTFRVDGLIRIKETATGRICTFDGFYYEFEVDTPPFNYTPLINFIDSYTLNIPALSVNDKNKIN